MRELFEERPLAVAAAAMALGLLAGLTLPSTRREDELLGERRDDLVESAREAGREALEQSRLAAHGAGQRMRASLREQELTPDQLADKVRQVARDAVSSVQQAERDFLSGFDDGAGGAGGAGGAAAAGGAGSAGETGGAGGAGRGFEPQPARDF